MSVNLGQGVFSVKRIGWKSASVLVGLMLILLNGCDTRSSDSNHAHSTQSSSSRYVAIARGLVDVEGGTIAVYAPRDGRIVAMPIAEGDSIQAGDVLAKLDPHSADLAVAAAEADVAQARAQAVVLQTRLAPAKQRAARFNAAEVEGLTSSQSADEANSQARSQHAEFVAAQAAVTQAQQRLESARWEREQRIVRSPVDARVARRMVGMGVNVSTQPPTEMFTLIPRQPLIVHADLEQDFAELVQPGMAAEVIDEVVPDKTYPATVQRVGELFTRRASNESPSDRQDVRILDCVLVLKEGRLRVGQRVLVRFIHG